MPNRPLTLTLLAVSFAFAAWPAVADESSRGVRRMGVTLYENADFRGRSETFYEDDPQLSDNALGSRRASSVQVEAGCEATLYEDPYYAGRQTVVREDVDDLKYSQVGNDTVASIRVRCRESLGSLSQGIGGGPAANPPAAGPPGGAWQPQGGRPWHPEGGSGWSQGRRRGVILFEDEDFRGRSETFAYDDPSLEDNLIGNDRVSSVVVDDGCEAALYEDSGFRGRYTVVRSELRGLRYTEVGNDRVSSIRVDCRRWSSNPAPDWRRRQGVALYEHAGFGGRVQILENDVRDLGATGIGNDELSSLRVAPRCRATLFADANFRGTSMVITGEIDDLRGTRLGNDRASSIQIWCERNVFQSGPFDWRGRRGVVLYSDADFRGREELFIRDDARLTDNPIRQDTASSVRVSPGCRVTLYADANYRGRATELVEDIANLSRSGVGNDSVSSLRVECRGGRY